MLGDGPPASMVSVARPPPPERARVPAPVTRPDVLTTRTGLTSDVVGPVTSRCHRGWAGHRGAGADPDADAVPPEARTVTARRTTPMNRTVRPAQRLGRHMDGPSSTGDDRWPTERPGRGRHSGLPKKLGSASVRDRTDFRLTLPLGEGRRSELCPTPPVSTFRSVNSPTVRG